VVVSEHKDRNVPKGDITPGVAVGTRVSSRAPRIDPYVRLFRIRLPPRVRDGKALAWPRVKDDRLREPGVHQLRHPFPRDPILLAAISQDAPPEDGDMGRNASNAQALVGTAW